MPFWSRRAPRTLPELPSTTPQSVQYASAAELVELRTRVAAMEASELQRNAEHAALCDRLDRLYKRVSARIARGSDSQPEPTESVLALKSRLKR
jgi:hypothetical protein